MSGQIAPALPLMETESPAARLASLFDTHHNRLYRLARRLTPNTDDALDLVQETFLKAARSPNSIPIGTPNEEAWLVRVLINIRRDQWRKASVREHHLPRPAVTTEPETALIAKSTVWQALSTLPPRRRAIVVIHELEGLAIQEIASLLGISQITVRWHLSRARRELSAALRSTK